MQRTGKLTGLINQAASAINMLSATDLSEVENLQTILDQIKQNIAEISDGPAQLLEQAQGTTSEAAEALQEILQKEAQDTAKSIEIISQAISTLQSLTDEIGRGDATSESEPAETEQSADVETASQEATVISEQDVAFILDFITEAGEHIESAEAGLLELESKPDDKEVINQIFRGFHTITGIGGLFESSTDRSAGTFGRKST